MNNNRLTGAISRRKTYPWVVLGVLILIYISSFVDRQIVAVLGVQIREALALSNTQIGILYGPAFSLIYGVFGIFLGRMADRYSRKRIIITGLAMWSLMTWASGFAQSFSFLITARIFVGVSQSALSPAVYSLLSDYFKPAQRATVFSLYASGIFAGIGLSYLIGGSIAEAYDWRVAMKAVGLPGIGIAVLAAVILREPLRNPLKKNTGIPEESWIDALKYILSKKTVWYYLAGFSLLSLNGYTILAFISTVLTDVFGAPKLVASYGWIMFLTGIGINISGWLADRFAVKWGPEKRFVMGIVAALGGLPFYYFGLFSESAVAGFILVGIGNIFASSYNGVAAALIQYFVKDSMRGIAGALYLFVISIVGFGFGPPVTGWLMDYVFTGVYGPSKALLTVFSVSGVLASYTFLRAMKSYHQDAEKE